MKHIKFIKWLNEEVTHTTYNMPVEKIIDIMRNNFNYDSVISTWLEDEDGNQIAFLDKNTEIIKGEQNLKKETKEEVLDKIYLNVSATMNEINQILEQLEEQRYIKFKKEPKVHKVFVKVVTIDGESKPLYYVTDFNLTDSIDKAKRFEVDEEKDGYAYELVEEF